MLHSLNEQRPIRRIGKTRRQLLEELDRPALKPLPIEPYMLAEWRFCRVGIDYHVDVGEHFYSVPYSYGRCEVEVRLTARTVEIFLKGKRIAAHVRGSGNRAHTTIRAHMPSSHQRYADWTIDRIRRDAASIGPSTATLCELILERRPHPEQGFRACLGILRLERAFGRDRLEAATARAIDINALTYRSVRSILDHKLDRQAANKPSVDGAPIMIHPNIRGSGYYN
jgi:transposase